MALTQDEWSELVVEWRKSGKSAAQFAAAHGVAQTALRYWIKRLPILEAMKAAATMPRPAAPPKTTVTALARVLRPGEVAPSPKPKAAGVRIVVGKAVVLVEADFDEAHLRAVVRAVSGLE